MGESDWLVDASVRIRRRRVGPLDNSCYVVACPETGAAVLIDAADEADVLIKAIGDHRLVAILQTHGHPDHWQALAELTERFPEAWVGAHQADLERFPPPPPSRQLEDGQVVEFGRRQLSVIHTPGHTAGSICFLTGSYLFTGDTLFPGGPGATHFPGGDASAIAESISSKLFVLDGETTVYPGHGLETQLGRERSSWGSSLEVVAGRD